MLYIHYSTWLGRKEDAEEERKERERMLRKAGKLPPAPSWSEKRKQVDGGRKNQGPPSKKPRTNNDYAQNQLARAAPGQLVGSSVKPGGANNSQQVRKPQTTRKTTIHILDEININSLAVKNWR
jgi:hypothetical protein